jgi:hypothetical protein
MQLSILSLVSNKSSTIREKALYRSRRGFGGKFALFLDVLPLKTLTPCLSLRFHNQRKYMRYTELDEAEKRSQKSRCICDC